ncbi:MAG: CBS domain-containing protein [Opitutae bacterium]|nr:CBS domain-containing protein [Opitutae bacterium]
MNAPISTILEKKGEEIFSVASNVTVSEAVQEMNKRRTGDVLVMDGDKLVGIFTERDVLVRVVGANRDPRSTPIAHVMTRDPVTIDAASTVEEVMDQHTGRHFRHLPVMDHGRLIGVLSVRDIMRYIADCNSVKAERLEEFIETGRNDI